MKQIHSYLTFNGNCRQAMEFYKECLGGELIFQTIGDTIRSEIMPGQMKESILHATLSRGNFVLMATDCVPDSGLIRGNSISLMLYCSNEIEIMECYSKLSSGGFITSALKNIHGNVIFGTLTDKYGNNWLLHFNKEFY